MAGSGSGAVGDANFMAVLRATAAAISCAGTATLQARCVALLFGPRPKASVFRSSRSYFWGIKTSPPEAVGDWRQRPNLSTKVSPQLVSGLYFSRSSQSDRQGGSKLSLGIDRSTGQPTIQACLYTTLGQMNPKGLRMFIPLSPKWVKPLLKFPGSKGVCTSTP